MEKIKHYSGKKKSSSVTSAFRKTGSILLIVKGSMDYKTKPHLQFTLTTRTMPPAFLSCQ